MAHRTAHLGGLQGRMATRREALGLTRGQSRDHFSASVDIRALGGPPR